MAVDIRLSPSRFAQAEACMAKWGFANLRPPEPEVAWAQVEKAPESYTRMQKAFAFGTAMHSVLETYYAGGKPDWSSEPGAAALRGLTLAPQPDECLEVRPEHAIEGEIDMSRVADAPAWRFVGRTDLHVLVKPTGLRRLGYPRAEHAAWMVLDWKSSASPAQYAVPREKLRVEPQGVLYPLALMHRQGQDAVGARWVYFPKRRGGLPAHTSFIQTRKRAEKEARRLYVLGDVLRKHAANEVDPNDLPKNRDHCDEYGGCMFRGQCKTPPERGRYAALGRRDRRQT